MRPWRPRVSRPQAALTLFLTLVGFLLVLQLRAGRAIRQEVELPTRRVRELAVLVQQQEEVLRALQAEIADLGAKLSAYETAAARGRSSAETLANEVASYKMVLGLTAVGGPGVIVTLSEHTVPRSVVMPIVQAQDLGGLANELWSNGAEAVAVNGIRVLATTGFRQTADGIVAGIFRLGPPYELRALGDPAVMKAGLSLRGGFVEGLRSVGIAVEIRESASLRLDAYRGPYRLRYARP